MRALKESVRNYKAFLFMLLCISPSYLQGLTAGSNTATTIQTFVSFPQTDTNNTMLGFGWFSNGFGLTTPQTTCTFNDFFPVGGPIYLNGGTLYLYEDLALNPSTLINTGGTINAQRHAVIFENEGASTIPIMAGGESAFLLTNANVYTSTSMAVGWSYDDKYLLMAAGGSNPGVWPSRLYSCAFSGNQLTVSPNYFNCVSNPVRCAQWHPTQYLLLMGASINNNSFRILRYNPATQTFGGIDQDNEGALHAVAWNYTGTYILLSRETSPYLKIYSFNLTTSIELPVTTAVGHPVYDPVYGIYFTISWSPTSSYFAATSTDTAHALTIYSFNGSAISEIVSATSDHLPSAVSWSPTSSFIAVTFYDSTSTASWLRVYQFTPPSTLTQVISYPGTSTGSATAVQWSRDGTQLALGVMANGINTFNTFSFNPTPPTIKPLWSSPGLTQYVFCCDWSHSDNYIAEGAYSDGVYSNWLSIYALNSAHGMVFKDASIQIAGDVYLNPPSLIFQGHCILEGNNCGLYLGSSGITVASGSSLLLKDLTIYNITGTNINCVDNTSTISFHNVTWSQDSDFTFTQGQMAITAGELVMTGGHRFIYQSDQPSTIYDHATWYFDNGMTFSYCPTFGETGLISFVNNSSTLYLYGTNLYAASTGLHLTKGCLTIDGPSQFMSDGVDETHGIWIGDGTSADDLKVKILAESGIIAGKGYVSYRNTK